MVLSPVRKHLGLFFDAVRTAIADVQSALIITRREIQDTLRDWRIVLPIVVLVAGFPILANFVAVRGIDFVTQYGAELVVERLYPFLMLTVGFFPSTFSLVIALETFVGEKERRSLEPLLATPLTDLQLYIGKLLASIIPPVAASYLGMGVYVLMLGFTLDWWVPLNLLILALALATIQAVVMVAGAVIVSSQSTSVRAANLVASFIILPMALLLQAQAGLLLFARYNVLWMMVVGLALVATILVRLGVRIFNREHLLGRDLDQLDLRRGWRAFRRAVWPQQGLWHLYRQEVPALIKAIRPELLITVFVIFAGGLVMGGWASQNFQLPASAFNLDALTETDDIGELVAQTGLLRTFSGWAVFLNNVRSLVAAAMLGLFSLGIMALILLMLPMAIIAYIGMQIGQVGINPWIFVIATVLPHGILELPAAILATAQAMRIGDILLKPPREGGGVLGVICEIGHFIKLFVLVVVPLLFAAAWIEVHITPEVLAWFLQGQ